LLKLFYALDITYAWLTNFAESNKSISHRATNKQEFHKASAFVENKTMMQHGCGRSFVFVLHVAKIMKRLISGQSLEFFHIFRGCGF
jgi:hypothetical protein